jgi:hypothetical protein
MAKEIINIGTTPNDGTGDPVRDAFEKVNSNFDELYGMTGWGVYKDTTYTTGSPFTVTAGAPKQALPNNAGSKIETQLPTDVATFYNGTTITGRAGDGILITIEFKARPTTTSSDVRLFTSIDIGGAIGEIYPNEIFLTKGVGVEHYFFKTISGYTLNTWETNGGTFLVESFNSNIEIYDIRYIITRTHKAR